MGSCVSSRAAYRPDTDQDTRKERSCTSSFLVSHLEQNLSLRGLDTSLPSHLKKKHGVSRCLGKNVAFSFQNHALKAQLREYRQQRLCMACLSCPFVCLPISAPTIPFSTDWLLRSKCHSVSSVYTFSISFLKHGFCPDELLTTFLGVSYRHCTEAEQAGTEDLLPVRLRPCHCVVPTWCKTFLDVCPRRCL